MHSTKALSFNSLRNSWARAALLAALIAASTTTALGCVTSFYIFSDSSYVYASASMSVSQGHTL